MCPVLAYRRGFSFPLSTSPSLSLLHDPVVSIGRCVRVCFELCTQTQYAKTLSKLRQNLDFQYFWPRTATSRACNFAAPRSSCKCFSCCFRPPCSGVCGLGALPHFGVSYVQYAVKCAARHMLCTLLYSNIRRTSYLLESREQVNTLVSWIFGCFSFSTPLVARGFRVIARRVCSALSLVKAKVEV